MSSDRVSWAYERQCHTNERRRGAGFSGLSGALRRQGEEVAMVKEALGEFEHHVLLAILRHGSRSYSVDIVRELEERTGKSVGVTSICAFLPVPVLGMSISARSG